MKRPARAGAFVRGLSPWRLPWMLGLMLACASPGVHGGLTNNWLQAYARAMDANAPCLEGDCCVPGAEGTAGGSGQPGVARGIMACRPCLEQERLEQQWEAQEAARAAAREGYRRLGEQDGPGRLQIGISSDGSVHVSQRVARGMPSWRVTEPEVNLWLEDRPLEYVPGRGPAVSVVLRYKNHAGVLGEYASTNGTDYGLLDTNVFSLGWRWGCEWRGWVEPGPGSTNATLHSGEGRVLVHGLGQVEYHTQRVLTLDASTNYYVLLYPSGAKDYYGLRSLSGTNYGALVLGTNRAGGTVLRYFLAERADPQGESLKFRYSISSNGPVRLEAVLDAEGRSTLLSYVEGANTTFAALVWKIRDPETNTVEFQYASSGALTNIIDPAGIATGLAYDEAQSVRSLVTAYGTTEFEYPALGNWRGLRVSEPDGAQHLWVASVSVSTELVTGIYDGSEVPCTEREGWFAFTNTFHLSELNTYDSFYWGPRQYALLSTNAVGSFGEGEGVGLFTNLTSGDYLASRMRHWLSAGTNRNEFSLTLALERAPSADGMTEGLKTWFDHEGKPEAYPGQEGTQRWPRCVATRAPGAAEEESVFTWFVRNALGHPTQVIGTYNDANGDWATRTNWVAYTSEGIDLLSHTNALGVAVFRNAYDPSAAHRLLASTNALGEVTEYTIRRDG